MMLAGLRSLNFCLEHHKHAIATIRGDHRLLLQDADGLFAQRTPRTIASSMIPPRWWTSRSRCSSSPTGLIS
jgi:hypothetical protein